MHPRKQQWAITAAVLVVTFAYAIVRYNVFKGVSWERLPLYISNKAIALVAAVFIALSYMLGPLARYWPGTMVPLTGLRKYFGLLGFGLAAAHGLISLLLFSPANYPKFFAADGTLNFTGELSMLFGVLAFFVFVAVAITSIPVIEQSMPAERWNAVQRLGYLGLLLVLLHVVVMGLEGWLTPALWPAGMPPISLVAAVVIAAALSLRFVVMILPRKKGTRCAGQ